MRGIEREALRRHALGDGPAPTSFQTTGVLRRQPMGKRIMPTLPAARPQVAKAFPKKGYVTRKHESRSGPELARLREALNPAQIATEGALGPAA